MHICVLESISKLNCQSPTRQTLTRDTHKINTLLIHPRFYCEHPHIKNRKDKQNQQKKTIDDVYFMAREMSILQAFMCQQNSFFDLNACKPKDNTVHIEHVRNLDVAKRSAWLYVTTSTCP